MGVTDGQRRYLADRLGGRLVDVEEVGQVPQATKDTLVVEEKRGYSADLLEGRLVFLEDAIWVVQATNNTLVVVEGKMGCLADRLGGEAGGRGEGWIGAPGDEGYTGSTVGCTNDSSGFEYLMEAHLWELDFPSVTTVSGGSKKDAGPLNLPASPPSHPDSSVRVDTPCQDSRDVSVDEHDERDLSPNSKDTTTMAASTTMVQPAPPATQTTVPQQPEANSTPSTPASDHDPIPLSRTTWGSGATTERDAALSLLSITGSAKHSLKHPAEPSSAATEAATLAETCEQAHEIDNTNSQQSSVRGALSSEAADVASHSGLKALSQAISDTIGRDRIEGSCGSRDEKDSATTSGAASLPEPSPRGKHVQQARLGQDPLVEECCSEGQPGGSTPGHSHDRHEKAGDARRKPGSSSQALPDDSTSVSASVSGLDTPNGAPASHEHAGISLSQGGLHAAPIAVEQTAEVSPNRCWSQPSQSASATNVSAASTSTVLLVSAPHATSSAANSLNLSPSTPSAANSVDSLPPRSSASNASTPLSGTMSEPIAERPSNGCPLFNSSFSTPSSSHKHVTTPPRHSALPRAPTPSRLGPDKTPNRGPVFFSPAMMKRQDSKFLA
eukprot:gene8260-1530_t